MANKGLLAYRSSSEIGTYTITRKGISQATALQQPQDPEIS
jgi:hypothetical protein